MRRWLAAGVVLAGCAAERADPARSRLAAGDAAIVASKAEDSVTMVPEGWSLEGQMERGIQLCHLVAGTRVECEHDPDDPPADRPSRPVKILVVEGAYKGRIGSISRENLRPVAK